MTISGSESSREMVRAVKSYIQNCPIYLVLYTLLLFCDLVLNMSRSLWNLELFLISIYTIEKSWTFSLSFSLSLREVRRRRSRKGEEDGRDGAVGLRITRGWHGHVTALDSMFSSFKPSSLSLAFSVHLVCPVPDTIRPISVPPHLSLFVNRKEASRSKIASKETHAWPRETHVERVLLSLLSKIRFCRGWRNSQLNDGTVNDRETPITRHALAFVLRWDVSHNSTEIPRTAP